MILGGLVYLLFLGGPFRADGNLWGCVALGGLAAALLGVWLSPQPQTGRIALLHPNVAQPPPANDVKLVRRWRFSLPARGPQQKRASNGPMRVIVR